MAWTSESPFGVFEPGGLPYTGPGLDPSYYYGVSPGGRFPGDTENAMEWQNAQARGQTTGNPFYELPDYLERMPGLLGAFFRMHQQNATGAGEGQSPDFPGGYPYHLFSGPAADYGPQGGPLHGLIDMGREGIWDTPEHRPPAGGEGGPEQPGRRGGGGGGGNWSFAPYRGIGGQAQFVDWQPIGPTSPEEATRFVPGRGGDPMPQPVAQAPAGRGGGGRAAAGGGQPGGGTGGTPRGGQGGGNQQRPASGQGGVPRPGENGMPTNPTEYFLEVARRLMGPGIGAASRGAVHGGVNSNMLDFMTPGWSRDRTTGIMNTSGMPDATLPGPRPGENIDQYRTRLHDAGYDQMTIASMTGPNGFRQNERGEWEMGWGTGPVVRDPATGAYSFANQGSASGGSAAPLWWQGDFYRDPVQEFEEFFQGASGGAERPSRGEGGAQGGGGASGLTSRQEATMSDFLSGLSGIMLR